MRRYKAYKSHRRRLLLLSRVLVVAGIVVLSVGAGLSWHQRTAEDQTTAERTGPNARLAAAAGDSAPSIQRPEKSEFDAYQVAPEAPRYISISKIAVRAIVKPLGITADNYIDSPRNIFDVGWYGRSARPGTPGSGAALMAGHVSSWKAPGVFAKLKTLKPGDAITIERGDGTLLTYKVIKSKVYDADKVNMDAVLRPINPKKPGLNLITCAGRIIKGTNNFDQRIVVFSEQI